MPDSELLTTPLAGGRPICMFQTEHQEGGNDVAADQIEGGGRIRSRSVRQKSDDIRSGKASQLAKRTDHGDCNRG